MFKNLLLAVDVNDKGGATKCAQAASSMAQSEGATLHVLNVVPDSGMAIVGASLSADLSTKVMEQAKADLQAWAEAAMPGDINVQLHVSRGTVYDQIIKAAESLKVDAIFVGAHRPELKDYLMGPNAARVARHAPQSVFVIR
ncbi:MAG: universal stress protein [Pseudomonadota bacterium]